jgi:tRNA pseudouridine38-40 synthase
MRYLKLTLQYDGTDFCGWQKQTGTAQRTVQGVLEEALSSLTGEVVNTTGAGRTDAGVHALEQVVHFSTSSGIPMERFAPALNSMLPPDLTVSSSVAVGASFHARYDVCAKKYGYLILNRRTPSALWHNYSYWVSLRLDEDLIQRGAEYLIGEHDFRAFSATGSNVKSTTRNILSFQVQRLGDWVSLTVVGNGFLYRMVRLMAGTLLAVGMGKWPPEAVKEILVTGERGHGGPALPPEGLYLMRIYYQGDDQEASERYSLLPPLLP